MKLHSLGLHLQWVSVELVGITGSIPITSTGCLDLKEKRGTACSYRYKSRILFQLTKRSQECSNIHFLDSFILIQQSFMRGKRSGRSRCFLYRKRSGRYRCFLYRKRKQQVQKTIHLSIGWDECSLNSDSASVHKCSQKRFVRSFFKVLHLFDITCRKRLLIVKINCKVEKKF